MTKLERRLSDELRKLAAKVAFLENKVATLEEIQDATLQIDIAQKATLHRYIYALRSDLAELTLMPGAKKARKKTGRAKPGYVNISPAEHWVRVELWLRYQHLKRGEVDRQKFSRRRGEHAPWTVEWFCGHVRDDKGGIFVVRELWRWLADTDTHAPGGDQDSRISRAITGEIGRMAAAGVVYPLGKKTPID